MYSIGKLCSEFHLSRSTLLYYSKIGLLTASVRTQSNYRQYSEDDKNRLRKICDFREAGVPLNQIMEMLDTDHSNERNVLEERLSEISHEIRYLRLKQKLIVEMLKSKNQPDKKLPMDSQTFASVLKSMGLNDETMKHFHEQFEKNSPDSHQLFLEFLGINDEDIKHIREFSRQ